LLSDQEFTDPLAGGLWSARSSGQVLEGNGVGELTLARARDIAREIHDAFTAHGINQVGWKVGATNPAGQARIGAKGPFLAPVFRTTKVADGGFVSTARFAQPRIEAEVGVTFGPDGEPSLTACIEIADCHFPGWDITLPRALADFGLLGVVAFGHRPVKVNGFTAEGALMSRRVRLSCDGQLVGEGTTTAREALGRVADLEIEPVAGWSVATGRATEVHQLAVGEWVAEIEGLGSVCVTVTPRAR
jgi:2-keto-4-pentenoate hydratase